MFPAPRGGRVLRSDVETAERPTPLVSRFEGSGISKIRSGPKWGPQVQIVRKAGMPETLQGGGDLESICFEDGVAILAGFDGGVFVSPTFAIRERRRIISIRRRRQRVWAENAATGFSRHWRKKIPAAGTNASDVTVTNAAARRAHARENVIMAFLPN